MPRPVVVMSYARENKDFVERLSNALKMTGLYTVWYDKEIPPGTDFPEEIAQAIFKCNYFIPVISRHFLKSRYCRKELNLALSNDKAIIPIRIDSGINLGASPELAPIASIQYIDVSEPAFSIEEFADIIKVLGAVQPEPNHVGIREYPNRLEALADFRSAIEQEFDEIMVIGSSLKGLLLDDDYRDTRELLQKKMKDDDGVRVRFLLIHPVFADIRARQEKRKPGEIGKEIIAGLEKLMEWDVPRSRWSVGLYKGTPTCFAIKTTDKMLLNPYPYRNVALGSPCIIIDRDQNEGFYEQFGRDHFGAWNTPHTEVVRDISAKIDDLKKSLERYSATVQALFNDL